MKKYNFDCYHFNGYTGVCNLKGCVCTKRCKDFQTDYEYAESLDEADVKIPLAELREICLKHTGHFGIKRCYVDLLIKTIKQDLVKK